MSIEKRTKKKMITKERFDRTKEVIGMLDKSKNHLTNAGLRVLVGQITGTLWSAATISNIRRFPTYEDYREYTVVANLPKTTTPPPANKNERDQEEEWELKVVELLTDIRGLLKEIVE